MICGTRDGAQGLAPAPQELYHWTKSLRQGGLFLGSNNHSKQRVHLVSTFPISDLGQHIYADYAFPNGNNESL